MLDMSRLRQHAAKCNLLVRYRATAAGTSKIVDMPADESGNKSVQMAIFMWSSKTLCTIHGMYCMYYIASWRGAHEHPLVVRLLYFVVYIYTRRSWQQRNFKQCYRCWSWLSTTAHTRFRNLQRCCCVSKHHEGRKQVSTNKGHQLTSSATAHCSLTVFSDSRKDNATQSWFGSIDCVSRH